MAPDAGRARQRPSPGIAQRYLRRVPQGQPDSVMSTGFYDDSVRQLNNALDARRDRLETASGGLPRDIAVLIIVSSFVIIAYAVLVGSPSFWFHVLCPIAIAVVVAVSLVVLVDLTYPFSGDVALTPDAFKRALSHSSPLVGGEAAWFQPISTGGSPSCDIPEHWPRPQLSEPHSPFLGAVW
jgi:hypothetical protein